MFYTSGVFAAPFGLDTRRDIPRIRGIEPQQFQDGFRGFQGFYNAPRAEVFTLDNIEVIKGPASTLYGQGALGGIVNANSKLPEKTKRGELGVTVGTDNRFQATLDTTGPINEDGTLLYRLVALGRRSDTEVEFVPDDAQVLMPSITWAPNEDTSLTLLANFQEQNTGSTIQFIPDLDSLDLRPFGLPLPPLSELNIDQKTFVGEAGFDGYETKSESYSAIFKHQFNDTFSVAMNTRYWESEADYQYIQALGNSAIGAIVRATTPIGGPTAIGLPALTEAGDAYRAVFKSDGELDIFASNLVFKAEGELFGLEHIAQFGIDYIDTDTKNERPRDQRLLALGGLSGYYLLGSKINLVNPVYTGVPQVPAPAEFREFSNDQTGVYFGDVIRSENVIASFNVRYDYLRQKYNRVGITPAENTKFSDSLEDLTADASIMYQFDNGISPYYSYAESFTPNDTDPNGKLVAPRTGEQQEIGIKYLSKDGDTFITAAIFEIDEENNVTDTNPATFRVIDGKYEGAELSAKHSLGDIQLSGAYTYLDAKVVSDNTDSDVPNIADELVSGWISYLPGGEGAQGLRGGVGARYVGETASTNGTFKTGGYTLFDAMLGYRFKDYDLQFNVTNLSDKAYTSAISESALGNNRTAGEGRAARLSAKVLF